MKSTTLRCVRAFRILSVLKHSLRSFTLVLCPWHKLEGFGYRGYSTDDIEGIHSRALSRFGFWKQRRQSKDPNAHPNAPETMPMAPPVSSASSAPSSRLGWDSIKAGKALPPPPKKEPDSLSTYLTEDRIEEDLVMKKYGGVLQWWEARAKECPHLASMAIAYLSAPASSVDAERAFSSGRLMVNHLQHNMSSDSFRAQVAIGSWARAGQLPDYPALYTALKDGVSRGSSNESDT